MYYTEYTIHGVTGDHQEARLELHAVVSLQANVRGRGFWMWPSLNAGPLCDAQRRKSGISPNSTWLVTSRLDTTRHVRRVQPMHFGFVELVEKHGSTH